MLLRVSTPRPLLLQLSSRRYAFRGLASSVSRNSHGEEYEDRDIVIVGGGPVGLALASALGSSRALAETGATITLIEGGDLSRLRKWSPETDASGRPAGYKNRVSSLTESSISFLGRLGVLPHLKAERTCPVHQMRVWDGLSDALIHFTSADIPPSSGTEWSRVLGSKGSAAADAGDWPEERRMATMVENSNLSQAFLRFLAESCQDRVEVRDVTRAHRIEPFDQVFVSDVEDAASGRALSHSPFALLHLVTADQSEVQRPIRARLLIGADGPSSPVRKYAGIESYGWEYGRRGTVGTLELQPETTQLGWGAREPGTAYQRFLPTGPIAFLPLSSTHASMVWTLPPTLAASLQAMSTASPSTVASLINAAFRLSWHDLDYLFKRIEEQSARAGASASKSSSEGNGELDAWAWVSDEITALKNASQGALSDAFPYEETGTLPPLVRMVQAGTLASFPLKMSHADAYIGSSLLPSSSSPLSPLLRLLPGGSRPILSPPARPRTVLVGDAAHTVHPLAGQGLNLGLADVAALARALEAGAASGGDLGSHTVLAPYQREQYLANHTMLSATDKLHKLYSVRGSDGFDPAGAADVGVEGLAKKAAGDALVWARSTGLEVINELPSVKSAIMGVAGADGSSSPSSHAGSAASSSDASPPSGSGLWDTVARGMEGLDHARQVVGWGASVLGSAVASRLSRGR